MTKRLKLGSRGFHYKVAQCLNFSVVNLTKNSKGSNYGGVVGFGLRCAISRNQGELELSLRSQLITNGKSYMAGFRFV